MPEVLPLFLRTGQEIDDPSPRSEFRRALLPLRAGSAPLPNGLGKPSAGCPIHEDLSPVFTERGLCAVVLAGDVEVSRERLAGELFIYEASQTNLEVQVVPLAGDGDHLPVADRAEERVRVVAEDDDGGIAGLDGMFRYAVGDPGDVVAGSKGVSGRSREQALVLLQVLADAGALEAQKRWALGRHESPPYVISPLRWRRANNGDRIDCCSATCSSIGTAPAVLNLIDWKEVVNTMAGVRGVNTCRGEIGVCRKDR